MKPFVFLDLAEFEGNERIPMEQLWHPHSGIATVTVILDGAVRIAETTGRDDVLPAGSRYYSVHTSEEALRKGEAEILRIGNELRANGTLRR